MAQIKRPRVQKARQAYVQATLAATPGATRQEARQQFEKLSKTMEGRTKIVQTAGIDPTSRKQVKQAIAKYATPKAAPATTNMRASTSYTTSQVAAALSSSGPGAPASGPGAQRSMPGRSAMIPGWKAGQTSYKTPTKVKTETFRNLSGKVDDALGKGLDVAGKGIMKGANVLGLNAMARTFTNPYVNKIGGLFGKKPNLPTAGAREAITTTALTAADIATAKYASVLARSLPKNAIFKPTILERVSNIPGGIGRGLRKIGEGLEIVQPKSKPKPMPRYRPPTEGNVSRSPLSPSTGPSKSPKGPGTFTRETPKPPVKPRTTPKPRTAPKPAAKPKPAPKKTPAAPKAAAPKKPTTTRKAVPKVESAAKVPNAPKAKNAPSQEVLDAAALRRMLNNPSTRQQALDIIAKRRKGGGTSNVGAAQLRAAIAQAKGRASYKPTGTGFLNK